MTSKTAIIKFRCTDEQKRVLANYADAYGLDMSEFIREAVALAIEMDLALEMTAANTSTYGCGL